MSKPTPPQNHVA